MPATVTGVEERPSLELRLSLEQSIRGLTNLIQTRATLIEGIREAVATLTSDASLGSRLPALRRHVDELESLTESLPKAQNEFALVWRQAADRIEESVGLVMQREPPAVQGERLQGLGLEVERIVRSLDICETWDTLRQEAQAANLQWAELPEGTTLESLPEAVAQRQVETRRALERLAAPRLLMSRLAEVFASPENLVSLDALLSLSDWETLLDGTASAIEFAPLHGVSLRRCAEAQSPRFAELRVRLSTASATLGSSLCAVTFLSREQLETWWRESTNSHALIQVALVRALCIAQRSDYWFWEPLRAFAHPGGHFFDEWGNFLAAFAGWTMQQNKFARLNRMTTEVLAELDRLPAFPERMRGEVLNRLSKAPPCNDSSRFNLRKLAHRRLWPEMRNAVDDNDPRRAIAIVREIAERDLDGVYDQWSAEINLSTRSLRDRFHEDIRAVLSMVEAWCRATQPETGIEEEQQLRALLRPCLEKGRSIEISQVLSPHEAYATFGRWLTESVRNGANAMLSADFPANDKPLLDQILPASISVNPVSWRAWGAQVETGEASFAAWALDLLEQRAGAVNSEAAIERQLAAGFIEAANLAAAAFYETGEAVSDSTWTRIDAALNRQREELSAEVENLRADFAGLTSEDRRIIEAEVPEIPERLSRLNCGRLRRELAAVRQLVEQTLAEYGKTARKRELRDQLALLQREPSADASVDELEKMWKVAWDETVPLRSHLGRVKKFCDILRQLEEVEVAKMGEQTLAQLSATSAWCGLPRTVDLELHLDHLLLELLEPVWQQSRNLLPHRREELRRFTELWLSALAKPAWLTDETGPWWRALRHFGEVHKLQPDDAIRYLQESGVASAEPSAAESPTLPAADSRALRETSPSLSLLGAPLQPLRDALDASLPPPRTEPIASSDLRAAFAEGRLLEVIELAGGEYLRLEGRGELAGKYARELLYDSVAALRLAQAELVFGIEVTGPLLSGINATPDCAVRTAGDAPTRLAELFKLCFFDAWRTEFALRELDRPRVEDQFRGFARSVSTTPLPYRLLRWLADVFRPCSLNSKINCPMLDAAWTALPAASGNPAVRGWLLWICLETGNWPALRRLLIRSNPEVMSDEQTEYFRLLLDDRERNWVRFESFLTDLRIRSSKRPVFLNFTERLLQTRHAAGTAVKVTLPNTLQKQRDGQTWLGQIRIEPPELDPPATLTLTLPEAGALRFAPGNSLVKTLEGGPFLNAVEQYCDFTVVSESATVIRIDVRWTGQTLTERPFDFAQAWGVNLRTELFEPIPPEKISEAFLDFSNNPVSGADYVGRPWDEDALKDLLFGSASPGSVWIRSPRRSGKTSILLRLVDLHGCRVDSPRENGLIHVNLASWNHAAKPLSTFIWEQLWGNVRNRGFAQCFKPEAEDDSEPLSRNTDLQIFLQNFASLLIAKCQHSLNRIYFLFDEADRLRSMHHAAEEATRELCRALLWQVREVIQSSTHVGVVFASVSSTARMFVEKANSAFYNSIEAYELKRFSFETPDLAEASLAIIQPAVLREEFALLPPETADHIIQITRGVPYYMRFVAGATFAAARSRTISRSDVNRGVQMLLNRELPGVFREMNPPGLDELSVLDAEGNARRRILALGVLLAAAELLNGFDHPYLLKNDLFRGDKPLKDEVRLSDTLIREGLELLFDLNFLSTRVTKPLHLEFTIPILGESLRAIFRTKWNEVIEDLKEIAAAGTVSARLLPPAFTDEDPAALRSRVEKLLLNAVNAEGRTGRIELAQAKELLVQEFPGQPIERQLGFQTVRELVRSLEALTLDEEVGSEMIRRGTIADLRLRVVGFMRARLDEWEGQGRNYTLGVLGNHLREAFPGTPVYERLGYRRLREFLEELPEFTVHGVGVHQVIRKAGESSPPPKQHQHNEHELKAVEAFVLRLLAKSEEQKRPLTMVYLGHCIRREFPGDTPIHERLGFERLIDLVFSLPGLRVLGLGSAHHIVRLENPEAEL